MSISRKAIEGGIVLLGLSGSRSYRTHIDSSDYEYKGACALPIYHYLKYENSFQQKDKDWDKEEGTGKYPELDTAPDSVIYDIRKFISLIEKQNPNILELLWLDYNDYLAISKGGRLLIENRNKLITGKIKYSFGEYANAQIRRMEDHRKWLLNPPQRPPTLNDFGLDENHLPLSKSELFAFIEFLYILVRDCIEFARPAEELRELLLQKIDYKAILKNHDFTEEQLPKIQELTRSSDDFIQLLHVTQKYRTELSHWNNYQMWLKKRNPERAKIEARVGFDGKHASHAIRLLKMAIEMLLTGELIVNRNLAGDAAFLRSIRLGEVAYEKVKEVTAELCEQLKNIDTSHLPKDVDKDLLNHLSVEIIKGKNNVE